MALIAAAARAEPQPARRARAGDLRHGDARPTTSPSRPQRPHEHGLDDRGAPDATTRASWSTLIHAARGRCAAIIINPGAFTHYAWSIHDALAAFDGPIVEVHISNPNAREPWRHTSVIAPVATGSIVGFGMHGYDSRSQAVAAKLAARDRRMTASCRRSATRPRADAVRAAARRRDAAS